MMGIRVLLNPNDEKMKKTRGFDKELVLKL